jgi:ribosomal protein S18 acetylase RimI-like enzyme
MHTAPPHANAPIEIVVFTPEEVLTCRDDVRAIYAQTFGAEPYREEPVGIERITQTLVHHTHKPGFRAFAAREASTDTLIGVIYGYLGGVGDWWWERVTEGLPAATADLWLTDCFEVAGFAVASQAQRRGIGTRLHNALLDRIPQRTAVLSAIQTPTPALALYRRQGWLTLREQFTFSPDGDPWRIMGLRLPVPPRDLAPAKLDPALRLRPFVPVDQFAVRTLILTGLGEHFGFIDETLNPDIDDIATTYLAAGDTFVVVERAGTLIGTGALHVESPEAGSLVRMSVASEARRGGIGRAIVAHLVDDARRRGLRRLTVETNKDWYGAIGLYVACGFREFMQDDESIYLQRAL